MEEKEMLKNIIGMLEHIEDLQKLKRIYRLAEYLYVYVDQEHPEQ